MQAYLQVAKNFVTRLANSGIKALGGILLVPFLMAKVGMEGYGLLVLTGVAVGLTGLADLGLRPALSRHLAARMAVGDWAGANRLVSTAVTCFLVIGLPLAIGLSAAAPWLVAFAKVSPGLHQGAEIMFRWYLPFMVVVSFLIPVYTAPLAALNRFDVRNRLDTMNWLLTNAVLVLVLSLTSLGLGGFVLASITTSLAYFIAIWRANRMHCPEINIRWFRFAGADLRTLFDTGKFLFGAQLIRQLKFQLDPALLTGFLGVGSVAAYRPGVALSSYARTFGSAFAGQLDSLTTQMHALGEQDRLRRLMREGSRLNVMMGMPLVLILVIYADPIMEVWLGGPRALGENYHTAALALICMALVEFLFFAEGMVWPVLMGMNSIQYMVKLDMLFATLNMLLSIALVAFTPLGILGVLIPSVLCELVARPIFVVHTVRVCGLPLVPYLKEVYGQAGAALGILTLFSVLVRWLVAPHTLPALLGCVAVVGSAWAAYVWGVGLGAEHRARFRALIGRLLPARSLKHAA